MEQNKPRKDIIIFGIASFLNDLGHYLVATIWPIFVTQTIGAPIIFLGFLDGFGSALESISQAVSGFFSDKIKKRKIFISIGYFFPFLSGLLYSVASTSWQLILGRSIDRSGKMRDAPRDAIIADETEHNHRATAFGFLRSTDRAGALVGLILSAFLILFLSDRQLFFLSALPALFGSLLIILFIQESKKYRPVEPTKKILFPFSDFNPNLKLFTLTSIIFTLASFSESFYILAARKQGFSLTLITLLYFGFVFFSFISALPFGRLADRIGRRFVLAIGYFALTIVNIMFVLFRSVFFIAFAFIIYGLVYGATRGNIKTFISDLAPAKTRASLIGAFEMIIGLTALPASLIAGLLWQNLNFKAPFLFSIGLSLIATALIFFVKESTD
ncbi:MAG: MFS transporter [Patescibacteria group bacterium]|nr:MFS transporter [Patescibacteria group bacterium]